MCDLSLLFYHFHKKCPGGVFQVRMCMIKNFRGGGGGVWGGGSSEGCLKGVVGNGGVIKGSLQKHLKTGGG